MAVIGTGASGVQTIQEVAKTAAKLVVFQRTPNWCAPLHNAKIPPQEMGEIRARYDEIFKLCEETFSCFLHTPDPRNTFEVSAEAGKQTRIVARYTGSAPTYRAWANDIAARGYEGVTLG